MGGWWCFFVCFSLTVFPKKGGINKGVGVGVIDQFCVSGGVVTGVSGMCVLGGSVVAKGKWGERGGEDVNMVCCVDCCLGRLRPAEEVGTKDTDCRLVGVSECTQPVS